MIRGSEWRKWDLHIHTPGTKMNDQFKDSQGKSIHKSESDLIWIEYCKALNESGNEAFGITDYFSADNYFLLKEKRDEWGLNRNIKLFPNIELRLSGLISKKVESKPHSHVNVHVIFNDLLDKSVIEKFLSHLTIIKPDGTSRNFRDDISELLNGKMLNSLPSVESLYNALTCTFGNDNSKYLIMVPNNDDGLSNTVGNGYEHNLEFMKKSVNIIQTTNLRDISYYLTTAEDCYNRKFPCVSGCDAHSIQEIYEYEKTKSTWIKADLTFEGLRSIIFEPENRVVIQEGHPETKVDSKIIDYIVLPEKDFGGRTVYFNSSMNTIIGSRSSGKSLLISLLAKKLANVEKVKKDNDNYERLIEDNLSETKIIFKDGTEAEGNKIIEFFYQDKLQEIASNRKLKNSFIEDIIGSKKEVENFKMDLLERKRGLSNLIIDFEDLIAKYQTINNELNRYQTVDIITENIRRIKHEITNTSFDFSQEELVKIEEIKANIKDIEMQIEKLKLVVSKYEIIYNTDMFIPNPELKGIITDEISIEIKSYTQKIEETNKDVKEYANLKLDEKQQLIDELNKQIIEFKNYALYKKYFEQIELAPKVKQLQENLDNEQKNLAEREKNNNQIQEIVNEINYVKNNILSSLSLDTSHQLDALVPIFNKGVLTLGYKIRLNIEELTSILQNIFKTNLNAFKDLTVGVFKDLHTSEIDNSISDLILFSDFKSTLQNIIESQDNGIFKVGKDKVILLKSLAEFTFVNFNYDIVYDGLEFNKMSEGKKAFVLLLIKLELEEEYCPLLIDQPEDNLDNRAIMKDLVNYFTKQKLQRQIIVVTHNANIVVNADSENVIIANEHDEIYPNPEGIKYYYKNGSLENIDIKKDVCEILEGGEPAFKMRENRYELKLINA